MPAPPKRRLPAVFLDRDGVLNADGGYLYRLEDLHLLSGVPAALTELKKRGFLLVVVSNQSGVARGYFTTADVDAFNQELARVVAAAGGPALDAFYYCPHLPNGSVAAYSHACDCRKPAPGLILAAAAQLPIDLTCSYMIGDKPSDVACALAAGVKAIQIAKTDTPAHPGALAYVASLADALPYILLPGTSAPPKK